MAANIRDYRPGDEAAAAYICLKTGDHGQDGEPYFREDPDALSRIYTAPYLKFCPELALLLEDAQGVCGYALAALDSHTFFERYERDVRPQLCERFPAPTGDASTWSPLQSVYNLYHHPDYFCPPPYEAYPSHLHIDLLPRAQGRGFGRKMIQDLLDRLRGQGSPGVYLGVSERNVAAQGFYRALGFHHLIHHEDTIYLGMQFGA